MAMLDSMLALMSRLETEFTPRIAAVLAVGMQEMLTHVQQTQIPADLSAAHHQLMGAEMRALWEEAVVEAAALFEGEEFKASDLLTRIAADYANAFGNSHLQSITDTTQRQIRDLMRGGLAAGQAVDAVYGELFAKIPQMALIRGLLITRTEVHSATQFATWRMALRSSVPLVKIWNSVNDGETRDFGELGAISAFNHRSMDGAVTQLTSPFHVPRLIGGYEPLMFPGDPTGSAANVINCRCVQTYERAR